MNIAIIFGASGGMGDALSQLLSRNVSLEEIWLVSRNREKLELLSASCRNKARIIIADLLDKGDIEKIKDMLAKDRPNIKWLVNCAGIGYYGDFASVDEKKSADTVELNCVASTILVKICLPYMEKSSHMLLLSSASAFLPQPKFSVYAASKAYVLSFARALRRELKKEGIAVSVACPGPVDTDFLNLAYDGDFPKTKKPFVASPDKVCKEIFKKAKKGRAIIVPTFSMKMLRILSKLLPHCLLLRIVK